MTIDNDKWLTKIFFDYSSDALFVTDPDIREIIDCNLTAVKLFEASSKEDLKGKNGVIFHKTPLSKKETEEIIAKINKGEDFVYEFEYKTLKGNTFWGAFRAKKMATPHGYVNLASVSDITQRKVYEKKMFESEQRFKNMANSSPAMMWVSDANGKISFYNKTWLQFRGISLESEVKGAWKDGIHPDDYEHLIQNIYNPAIDNKTSYTVEYRLKRHDGAWRWILEKAIPKFSEDGVFEGLYGSAIDITEVKLAQIQIAENETKFKTLANTSPVMLWTCDIHGLITFYNDAWLNFRGRTIDQEIGNGWIEGVHPDDLKPFVYEVYFQSIKQRKAYQAEYRLMRHDGVYRWMFETGIPKWDANGEWEGMVGSAIDITDRKEAELKLKQQENFISRIQSLAPDIIYIYDLSLKQNIYCNRPFPTLLGYKEEDYPVLNEQVFLQLLHPDDAKNVLYSAEHLENIKSNDFVDLEC